MRHVMRLMAVIWCALTVSPVGTAQDPKRAEADPLRPGQVFRDCPDLCPEMVVVPAGSFMMGSGPAEIEALVKQFGFEHFRSEGPQRRVTIARPFAVGPP